MRSSNMAAFAGIACAGFLLSGCGDKSSTEPSYADLSGRYTGNVAGVSNNVVIAGVFALIMTQSGAATSGTSEMNGFIGSGSAAPAFAVPGVAKGAVGSGVDPSFTVSLTSNACPTHTMTFAGTYQSANKRLVLNGTVEIYASGTCAVSYSCPATLLLMK